MKNNQVIIESYFREKGPTFEEILKESINVYIENSLSVKYIRQTSYNTVKYD